MLELVSQASSVTVTVPHALVPSTDPLAQNTLQAVLGV